ncbi:MAG: hypothetical protein P4M11_11950 [Candidatus Pacebacteria bacterium]|nr:hypothetical protein [Candidatus Paceibacterota bacterium]
MAQSAPNPQQPQFTSNSLIAWFCALFSFQYGVSIFSPRYYKTYFNISSWEVLSRVLHALFPFVGAFYSKIKMRPDLYRLHLITGDVGMDRSGLT